MRWNRVIQKRRRIVGFLLGSGVRAARGGVVEGTSDSKSADIYLENIYDKIDKNIEKV